MAKKTTGPGEIDGWLTIGAPQRLPLTHQR
jgi:hypothetical protein